MWGREICEVPSILIQIFVVYGSTNPNYWGRGAGGWCILGRQKKGGGNVPQTAFFVVNKIYYIFYDRKCNL
jgi:hypothetical protein